MISIVSTRSVTAFLTGCQHGHPRRRLSTQAPSQLGGPYHHINSRPGVQTLRKPQWMAARNVVVTGLADDVVGGFFDLSKLVSSGGTSQKSVYEELAYKIGQDVYADFGGWHLYLRDMKGTADLKMSQVLANAIGSKMSANGFDERDVEDLLKGIPVNLGAGKLKVPLSEVLPSFCVQDLMEICSDFARDL